ncbi:MAG: hypothetical protein ACOYOK_12970, partial [Pseudobdellovibrionaceae bacterium]
FFADFCLIWGTSNMSQFVDSGGGMYRQACRFDQNDNKKHIHSFVQNTREPLMFAMLYFEYKYLTKQQQQLAVNSWESKLFSKKDKTIYDLIRETKINLVSDKPCLDFLNQPKDGSVANTPAGTICISADSIAKKLDYANVFENTFQLVGHELSHLLGTTEDEANAIQANLRYLNPNLLNYQGTMAQLLLSDENNQNIFSLIATAIQEKNQGLACTQMLRGLNFVDAILSKPVISSPQLYQDVIVKNKVHLGYALLNLCGPYQPLGPTKQQYFNDYFLKYKNIYFNDVASRLFGLDSLGAFNSKMDVYSWNNDESLGRLAAYFKYMNKQIQILKSESTKLTDNLPTGYRDCVQY